MIKINFIYYGFSSRLCPKRLSSSTSILKNPNNQKEYLPIRFSNLKITPEHYTNSKQILSSIKNRIPDEFLTRKNSLDSLYLIDPLVARKIGAKILPYLEKDTERVIVECNPGLGLLTRQILKTETGPIKLFEPSQSFRQQLKKLAANHNKRLQLYSKHFFKLSLYNYTDKQDNGDRVEKLLKNLPKKAWTDDPAVSVIGPVLNNKFLNHIIEGISTQTSLSSYGRVEMFLIMKPFQYLVLSIEQNLYLTRYDYMTVLFNLFFEYKLLRKLPREAFLPWERPKKKSSKLYNTDNDMLYLVYIVVKKDLPLPLDELVPFLFFMRKFFKRKAKIIPMLEFCVPNCGEHVILPQLQHENYFEHIDIFTEFKELTPNQVLGVFREIYKHPNYLGSPLFEMVEADMIKTEISESNYMSEPENTFMDEIEELDLEDNLSREDSNNR